MRSSLELDEQKFNAAMRSSFELDTPALNAANRGEESGVRVFKLKRHKRNKGLPVRVTTFGCHGDGLSHQAAVANSLQENFARRVEFHKGDIPKTRATEKSLLQATKLQNRNFLEYRQMLQKEQNKAKADPKDFEYRGLADFMLLLGDNAYTFGSSSPTDPVMHECFHQAYINNKDCPLLNKMIYFVIGGNHDGKYCKQASVLPGYDPEKPGNNLGVNRLMNQIAYTYIKYDESGFQQFNAELDDLLNSPPTKQEISDGYRELDLDELLSKNCHYLQLRRFYSLIIEDHQYFCVDSSDFPRDFLAYKKLQKELRELDPTKDAHAKRIEDINKQLKNNQAAFLAEESKKALLAGRTMILAGHHSLVTDGSRHAKDDRKIYLSKNEMEQLAKLFADDCEVEDIKLDKAAQAERVKQHQEGEVCEIDVFDDNMNSQYLQSLRMLGLIRKDELVFDAVLTAHDHNMSNFCTANSKDADEYKFCQFTAGAGSSRELQSRMRLSNQRSRGCFIKKPGFLEIEHYRAQHSLFTFRTADGENTLLFSNESPRAIVDLEKFVDREYEATNEEDTRASMRAKFNVTHLKSQTQKENIQKLFATTETTITEYFRNMDTYKLDADGIERAHNVWAFISDAEPKVTKFDDVLHKSLKLAESKNSLFYTMLVTNINKAFPGILNVNDLLPQKQPSMIARAFSSIFSSKASASKPVPTPLVRKSASNDDMITQNNNQSPMPFTGSN